MQIEGTGLLTLATFPIFHSSKHAIAMESDARSGSHLSLKYQHSHRNFGIVIHFISPIVAL